MKGVPHWSTYSAKSDVRPWNTLAGSVQIWLSVRYLWIHMCGGMTCQDLTARSWCVHLQAHHHHISHHMKTIYSQILKWCQALEHASRQCRDLVFMQISVTNSKSLPLAQAIWAHVYYGSISKPSDMHKRELQKYTQSLMVPLTSQWPSWGPGTLQ
jgi:hypothetical protein